jgi:hypothetical protein
MPVAFAGNARISLSLPAVNRMHRKQGQQFLEPLSGSLYTSVYPDFHIPRKQAETTNQVQPRTREKGDIATYTWSIYKPRPPPAPNTPII